MGYNCDLEHRSSKDVAIDLQNALKKLGYNNQTRITMEEDLLIRLYEDRFIQVEFNRHNWDCEVKDTKNDKSVIEQVIIDLDEDKAYTSGIHTISKTLRIYLFMNVVTSVDYVVKQI